MNAQVLVIESEPQIARILRINFARRGYETDVAPSGETALAAAGLRPPALVILDLDLPDMSGVEVIRSLRRWSRAPIVVLSVPTRSRDMVEALDAGADDYITRPFDIDELMARLRAVLRRAGKVNDVALVRVGGHTVNLAQHTVTGPDGEVDLTPTEWGILEVLVRNAGKLVSRERLLTEVGGTDHLRESNSLRVHMAHLRHKLESDPARPRHLRTEPGMGYRFVA
jgi:two-component system, OmpR family, KDP operon response regulator KdpE